MAEMHFACVLCHAARQIELLQESASNLSTRGDWICARYWREDGAKYRVLIETGVAGYGRFAFRAARRIIGDD